MEEASAGSFLASQEAEVLVAEDLAELSMKRMISSVSSSCRVLCLAVPDRWTVLLETKTALWEKMIEPP